MNNNIKFIEWLAGLIDGDGCFLLSQKGYGSLEITMDSRDSYCLYIVKNKYGGSVKLRSGSNSFRYRLHHKSGLLMLLNDVNGLIRGSNRLLQFNKLCFKYNIIIKNTINLEYNSGWMGGFFDSDGTISINKNNNQLSISIGQKTQELLILLKNLYGGEIYIDRSSNTFKWYIANKEEILCLKNNYFKNTYVYSKKRFRLFLIDDFYNIKQLNKNNDPFKNKIEDNFYRKWNNYIDE